MHINIGMYVCMYIPVYIARTCLCKYLSLSLSFGGENASMTYSCRQTNVKWGGDFSGLVLNESIKQIKYLISSNPRGVCPLNGRCKCQVGWLNSQKIICLIKCRIIKWWSANTLQDWSLFKCSVFCFPFVIVLVFSVSFLGFVRVDIKEFLNIPPFSELVNSGPSNYYSTWR